MPKPDPEIRTLQAMSDGLAFVARSLSLRADSIMPAGRQELIDAKDHCNVAVGLIRRAINRTGEP